MSSRTQGDGMPQNKLLEAAVNIFALAAPLLSGDRRAGLGPDFRARIEEAFREFERHAFEWQLDQNAVVEAKYALATFVDEKVLGSAWPHKTDWMGRPLQLEFFGEHLGGENFYKRLARHRQGGARNVDLLEVYYACLQLGFEGVYRIRGMEPLMALVVDLRAQINDSRPAAPVTLSPNGGPQGNFVEFVSREVPFWVIGVITLSFLVFVYLGLVWALDQSVKATDLSVHNDLDRIQMSVPEGGMMPNAAAAVGSKAP